MVFWGYLAIAVSLVIAFISYSFTYFAIVLMLGESKPWMKLLLDWISYVDTHRIIAVIVLITFGVVLFVVQLILISRKKINNWKWLTVAIIVGLICTLSYPMFSKDLFTYIFSAKMVWFYRTNPYLVRPDMFFGKDLWLDFMHNVDRVYVYGPVYLLYSLIPMVAFGYQRFLLNFLGIKLLNGIVFVYCGWRMFNFFKQDSKVLAFWFFNPFLLLELLINSHNDLLMISLFIIAELSLKKGRIWVSRIWYLLSILSKFVSLGFLPIFFIGKNKKQIVLKMFFVISLVFLIFKKSNPWYFTWLFMLIPFIEIRKIRTWIMFFVWQFFLVMAYIPFVFNRNWIAVPLIDSLKFGYYLVPALFILWEVDYKNLPGNIFNKRVISG